ncbi:hypothetical protein ACG04Q_04290 [Roseateles sp. DXS20W]|uniref:Autotransporter outer membrane beta-barrel domain-containing protein n=1 Tax=Pelomonas lactea TaxID=3299030 RepID=A0ABW7GG26_9BURK
MLFHRLAGTAFLFAHLAAPAAPTSLAGDPEALTQLVNAVSLDVMSEASLEACEAVGAPAFEAMRTAWVAWREQHQLAPLRSVVMSLKRRNNRSAPWSDITDPLRERVLSDPAPDKACAALARDWQTAGLNVSAMFPQARATAKAVVMEKLAHAPTQPELYAGTARGQVLLPTQIEALAAQNNGGWSDLSEQAAERKLGWVFVKGRVKRWSRDPDRFSLVLDQGERISEAEAYLRFDAESWVGREIVVRGLVTSLRSYALTLENAALVTDPSGLTPSPLAQQPLGRKDVLLQRVMRPPGSGLADKDLAAVVIHGQSDFSNGTRWEEDVRFLLKDGTAYRRTEMPPDQLDVAASRKLEPQQWARWRSNGKAYDMQAQDVDGRPAGDWKPQQHHAVKPWPQGTRLDGYFSRDTFSGSLALGGVSSTRAIRFTRDGRFERSYSSLGTSGGMAAMNGAVISASSRGDGKGNSSTAGGTVSGAGGTVGATSGTTTRDDGASRRGRYQLGGYVLTLDYDDGHQERLLSFPVYADGGTVYVGSGSLTRSDR